MTTPASAAMHQPMADPPRRRFGSGFAGAGAGARPSPTSSSSPSAVHSRPNRPTSSSSTASASASASASGSTTSLTLTPGTNTPGTLLASSPIPSPGLGHNARSDSERRGRSLSSASLNSSNAGVSGSGAPAFDITLAADKAQQWLSTWAPRGEGRGREFLNNTLNGVASVASTVSSGLNARHDSFGSGDNRRRSFISASASATSPTNSVGPSPSTSPDGVSTVPPPQAGAGAGAGYGVGGRPTYSSSSSSLLDSSSQALQFAVSGSPSGPAAAAAPTRRPPQPANLSRLGHANTTAPTVTLSSSSTASSNGLIRPPIPSSQGSTSSLPTTIPRSASTSGPLALAPHGPSHLNPNAAPAAHNRSGSFHSRSPSFGFAKSPSVSRSSSLTARSGPSTRSAGMPYKIGFQPAGVRADRTGDYLDARRMKGEDREKEEGRLGRRWAKLVDLHFNPTIPTAQQLPVVPTLTRSSSSTFSIASLADKRRSLLSFDGALDALKPKELLKGFKSASAGPGGDEGRKRAAEQAIVKWEDDGEAKKCRICQSSFSLSNRKHHCRLCGRVICSLPPTPPALLAVQIQLFAPADPSATSTSQAALPPGTRREKCSLLLVADWKTGRGEEVEEGFVGWMKMEDGDDSSSVSALDQAQGQNQNANLKRDKRRSRPSVASVASVASVGSAASSMKEEKERDREMPLPQQPKEVQVKGVRCCRECWGVVSRKQKMADRARVTGFARLYQALRGLQGEIEELIPEFEDKLSDLVDSSEILAPSPELLTVHKHLLTLFTQYEHLSKRISSLTCEEGGSQALVQSAVARSAAGFMAKEMVKLQALPKLQKRAADAKRRNMTAVIQETTLADQLALEAGHSGLGREVEDTAMMLQPLLEQEAQLESYIADAVAQRKYEDGKALQEALRDIKSEIERITLSASASR